MAEPEQQVASAARHGRSALLVEMRRIEKHFPGVHALRGARFDLMAGEVHALMGENGAGKSTLMKVLTGVNQPDSGEILIDGNPVTLPGPRAAQNLGISIIHQELHLMSHLTAAQNIFIGREPRRGFGWFTDEAKANADAAALFRRMKIDIDPKGEVGHLTVARQQLVEIAKALSFNSQASSSWTSRPRRSTTPRSPSVRHHRGLEGARRRRRLHHSQDGRGEADRRSRHRHARRPDHRARSPPTDADLEGSFR